MVTQSKSNEDEFLLDALKDNTTILCEYRKFGKSKGPAAKKQLKHETAESLYDSVDGYGLQSLSQGAGISDWIMNGRSRMPPSEYIQYIKVRAAVLPNNLRISRYHPEINTYCDFGCGAFEYLDHIFQVCPSMDAARRKRRNNLVRQFEKTLTKKDCITKVESRISIDGNIRIPDLIAYEKDQSIVCDVTIVSVTGHWKKCTHPKCKNMVTKTFAYGWQTPVRMNSFLQRFMWLHPFATGEEWSHLNRTPRLLQKHVNEFVNYSSFWRLPYVETS